MEAIESLQQQLEQMVGSWMQGALSAVQSELNVSASSLQSQLQEACRKEGQNQRRMAAAAPPPVALSVGAGRAPASPPPHPGHKAAMGSHHRASNRMMVHGHY
jgi:hypothetical protein